MRLPNPRPTSKRAALMRLRHLADPEDLLKKYKPSQIIVEQKLDGWKVPATRTRSGVRLYSRNGNDLTANASPIVHELSKMLGIGDEVLGELVYVKNGKQCLTSLQSILRSSSPARAASQAKKLGGELRYRVYDQIADAGKCISKKPLTYRKKILAKTIPARGRLVRRTKVYKWSERDKAMKDSLKVGGEGAVFKIKDSPYLMRGVGKSEPWGEWWKHKVPGEKYHTEDVILLGYEKREKRLAFKMYQNDRSGKRVFVGYISTLPHPIEKDVKKMSDRGKPIVAEISHQQRFPSGKFRHPGWIRLRPDKPLKSATMSRKSMSRNPTSERREKPYTVYLVQEKPRGLVLYSFSSRELISPSASASQYSWLLGESALEKSATHIFTSDAKLTKFLRSHPGRITRGRPRHPNPRNSKVKDALAAEATRYKDFNEFSSAYWNACSRGLYWIATNEKRFHIGLEERKRIKNGTFFVACSPSLALSGKNEGKKFVAELDVTRLPKGSIKVKRGSGGSEIKIVDSAGAIKVTRVLEGVKAKRSFKWQLSILPSSKDELRAIWEKAWDKRHKDAEKKRIRKEKMLERELKRAETRVKEDAKAVGRAQKKVRRKAAEAKRERERKSRKAKATKKRVKRVAATREATAAVKAAAKKKSTKKKPTKKKPTAKKKASKKKVSKKAPKGTKWVRMKNPSKGTRRVRSYVNNPGR